MLLDNFARSINATRVRIQSRGGLIFLGLALLLGGGGRSHPALTAILELSAILLLWAQMGHPRAAARPLILKLALALWAIWFFWLLVQIIALPPGIWQALPGREAAVAIYEAAGWSGAWHAISLTPDKSFAHLLAALPALAMFLVGATANRQDMRMLLRIVLGIALASAILGILQLGAGADAPFYLFDTAHKGAGVGLFINRNHQAVFLLVAIVLSAVPGIVLPDRQQRRAPSQLPALVLLTSNAIVAGAVLATTSRTAITLLPFALIGALSVGYLGGARGHLPKLLLVLPIVGLGLLATPVVQHVIGRFATVAEDQRQDYWENTILAIEESFPAGTGAGSFRTIYPLMEPLEQVSTLRVNNAHNDFLELTLELSLPGLLILGAAILLLALAAISGLKPGHSHARRAFSLAACVGILLLLAFSLVDYPLRMTSLLVLASLLIGLLMRATPTPQAQALRESPRLARWSIYILLLVLGWQVIATHWARWRVMEGDGAGAVAAAPWRSDGWSLLADRAIREGRPQMALAPARRALAIAPLDPVAVRSLGLGLLASGHDQEANSLLEAGARLGWRDGVLQYWLIERATALGAWDIAVQRLDALLRLNRATDALLERLVAIARVPQGRTIIALTLSARPGWRQAFFNALARNGDSHTSLAMIRAVNATSAPVIPRETALIRWRLADQRQWAAVREVWALSGGEALIGDGAFSMEFDALGESAAPYAWRAPSLAGGHAVIAEPDRPWQGRAALVTSDGLAQGIVLAQALALEPGHYEIRLLHQKATGEPQAHWTLACRSGQGEADALAPIALRWRARRDQWVEGRGRITISPACPAQDLRLQTVAGDGRAASFFVDDVVVIKARAAAS